MLPDPLLPPLDLSMEWKGLWPRPDHFVDAFIHENIAYNYMSFENLYTISYFLEYSGVRKRIF